MASHGVSVALSRQSRPGLCDLCGLSLCLPLRGGNIAAIAPDIPPLFKAAGRALASFPGTPNRLLLRSHWLGLGHMATRRQDRGHSSMGIELVHQPCLPLNSNEEK